MSRISNGRRHVRQGALAVLALLATTIGCVLGGLGSTTAEAVAFSFPKPTMIQTDETTLKPGEIVHWTISQSMAGVDYDKITQFKFYDPFPDTIEYPAGNIYYDGELNKDRDGTMRTEEHACTYTFSADGLAAIKEKRPSVIEFRVSGTISSKLDVANVISVVGYVTINTETQDTIPVETHVGGDPSYTLTKTADKEQAAKGETVAYTVTAKNTGEGDGKQVVIEDELADGLELQTGSVKVSGIDGGSYTIDQDSLSAHPATVKVTIPVFKVSSTATITYNATVTSTAGEGTKLQNTAELVDDSHRQTSDDATVTLTHPGLSLTKDADRETVNENEKVGYTLTLKNTSTLATAANVVVNDAPPTGLAIEPSTVQIQGADGSPQQSVTVSSLKVEIESLAPQKTVTITYQATAQPSAVREQALSSAATAKADGISDVSDGAEVKVNTNPHFAFTMTGRAPSDGSAQVGSSVSFDVTITNDTPHPIKEVTLENALPKGLILAKIPEVSTDGGERVASGDVELDDNTLTAKVPELGSNASMHLSYSALVTEEAEDSVTNRATVSAQGAQTQDQSYTFSVTRASTPLPQTGVPSVMALLTSGGVVSTAGFAASRGLDAWRRQRSRH